MTQDRPLPAPTRDHDQARRDLTASGYCLVAVALPGDVLAAFRARVVEQVAAERERGIAILESGGVNQRVTQLFNKGGVFTELALHPVVRAFMPGLLGESYLFSSLSANIAGEGGERMVLHEDQCHPPKTPYPLVANVGWLLDDFHEANGGTLVVPGSHLRGHAPTPAIIRRRSP